jgi:hypothetical protein
MWWSFVGLDKFGISSHATKQGAFDLDQASLVLIGYLL